MSSLAASRADNFYFPPEYDGRVHGGLSKFNNPDYKGSNQWEQKGIIRFELPFDGWCLGCKRHMCKGLRFNAKKEKVGKYFSTSIFSFTMKCHSCPQELVIKTDPQNTTYDFFSGIRKMEQDYEAGDDDNVVKLTSDDTRQKMEENTIFKLEFENKAKASADIKNKRLIQLIEINDLVGQNDYDNNCKLRKINRNQKNKEKSQSLNGKKLGLSIPLLDPSDADRLASKKAKFKPKLEGNFGTSERIKFTNIQSQSIFPSSVNSNQSSKTSVNINSLVKQAKHMVKIPKSHLNNDINESTKSANIHPVQSREKPKESIRSNTRNEKNALALISGYTDDEDC